MHRYISIFPGEVDSNFLFIRTVDEATLLFSVGELAIEYERTNAIHLDERRFFPARPPLRLLIEGK